MLLADMPTSGSSLTGTPDASTSQGGLPASDDADNAFEVIESGDDLDSGTGGEEAPIAADASNSTTAVSSGTQQGNGSQAAFVSLNVTTGGAPPVSSGTSVKATQGGSG
jgi:hypothetical protein